MDTSSKTVSIFISSTFMDMQSERDYLVKRVFPELRHRLARWNIYLYDIDLRWGITAQQSENNQVIELCLQHIDDCHPFFLGLLGDRYGWVPPGSNPETRSLTETEIVHGVLRHPEKYDQAIFAFRSSDFISSITDAESLKIYQDQAQDESPTVTAQRFQQLQELKTAIRKISPPVRLLDGYQVRWTNKSSAHKYREHLSGLEDFGKWLTENIEQAILNSPDLQTHLQLLHTQVVSDQERERLAQLRFSAQRASTYIGQDTLLNRINHFLDGKSQTFCLLTGPSGIGKSATLASIIQTPQRAPVIAYFAGASAASNTLNDMLQYFCAEMSVFMSLERTGNRENESVTERFIGYLQNIPINVILVIDGLNQFPETERSEGLHWLPPVIPANVRLIISCIDSGLAAAPSILSTLRLRKPDEIQLEPLDDSQRLKLLQEIPSLVAKTLDEEQIQLLMSNEATRNPLYLTVALEELRNFGFYEKLNDQIRSLPTSGDALTALFRAVFERLRDDFEPSTVQDLLCFIASSRTGLAERELLDLIEEPGIPIEQSKSDLFYILRQLRPYLQYRGFQVDFFHNNLRQAVIESYQLDDSAALTAIHSRLADYFLGLTDDTDPKKSNDNFHIRGYSESIFHLLRANREAEAARMLTDFSFIRQKVSFGLTNGLLEELSYLTKSILGEMTFSIAQWHAFFQANRHFLNRTLSAWPAEKLVLQLALEYAHDSPVTRAADRWLAQHPEQGPVLISAHIPDRLKSGTVPFTLDLHHPLVDWREIKRRKRNGDLFARGDAAAVSPCPNTIAEKATKDRNEPIAVLPYGRAAVAVHFADQSIAVLSLIDGHRIASLAPPSNISRHISLSGKLLAIYSPNGELLLYDMALDQSIMTGQSDRTAGGVLTTPSELLCWYEDGSFIALNSLSGNLTLQSSFGISIASCILTDLNGLILAGSADGYVSVYDPASGRFQAEQLLQTAIAGYQIAGSEQLIIWDDTGGLAIMDTSAITKSQKHPPAKAAIDNVVVIDANSFLSWHKDRSAQLWRQQQGPVKSIYFNDGPLGSITIGQAGGLLAVWVQEDHPLYNFKGHFFAQRQRNYYMDTYRERVYYFTDLIGMTRFDPVSLKPLEILDPHAKGGVLGVIYLAGDKIATWCLLEDVMIWNRNGEKITAIKSLPITTLNRLVSITPERFISIHTTGKLMLWDEQGALVRMIQDQGASALVVFNLSSERFAVTFGDFSIGVYQCEDGAEINHFFGHYAEVNALTETDDDHLLSWTVSGELRLWNLKVRYTRQDQFLTGGGMAGIVKKVSAETVVSCHWGVAKSWDIATGRMLHRIDKIPDNVNCMVQVADDVVLMWCRGMTIWNDVYLWKVRDEKPLVRFDFYKEVRNINDVEVTRVRNGSAFDYVIDFFTQDGWRFFFRLNKSFEPLSSRWGTSRETFHVYTYLQGYGATRDRVALTRAEQQEKIKKYFGNVPHEDRTNFIEILTPQGRVQWHHTANTALVEQYDNGLYSVALSDGTVKLLKLYQPDPAI